MLRPRVIPCLLLKGKGLVKSEKFKDYKYVGDPLNAIRIFNEKRADELILLDIEASKSNREPNFSLIEKVASECRMPLCYGGGIKTKEQALKILSLGVEKISISHQAIKNPELIKEIAASAGSQSVVVTLDFKKGLFGNKRNIYTLNGKEKAGLELTEAIKLFTEMGAGEFVLNDIDRDGTLVGYDLELYKELKTLIKTPITIMGGAKDLANIKDASKEMGSIGLGVGRLFVLKGKHKAVLINYNNQLRD